MLTEIRGASNAKAKRELDWQPRHSWRRDLGSPDAAADPADAAAHRRVAA
jgi:hypothetical protein